MNYSAIVFTFRIVIYRFLKNGFFFLFVCHNLLAFPLPPSHVSSSRGSFALSSVFLLFFQIDDPRFCALEEMTVNFLLRKR